MSTKTINGKRYIRRRGYTRSDGTKVRSAWVPDKGAPGKTPKRKRVLPKLKENGLGRFGYKLRGNRLSRRRAISAAMKSEGGLPIIRRLVVLRSYHKRSPYFGKLDRDVKYAQEKYVKRSVRRTVKRRVAKRS